jgi:hypothetical protein
MHLSARVDVITDADGPVAQITYGPNNISVIKKAQWDQNSGNLLRLHIYGLNSYGYEVKVISAEERNTQVEVDGQIQSFPVLRIHLQSKSITMSTDETIDLVSGLPGFMQIVHSEEDNTGFGHRTRSITAVQIVR